METDHRRSRGADTGFIRGGHTIYVRMFLGSDGAHLHGGWEQHAMRHHNLLQESYAIKYFTGHKYLGYRQADKRPGLTEQINSDEPSSLMI